MAEAVVFDVVCKDEHGTTIRPHIMSYCTVPYGDAIRYDTIQYITHHTVLVVYTLFGLLIHNTKNPHILVYSCNQSHTQDGSIC